jgi:hypothetical protein
VVFSMFRVLADAASAERGFPGMAGRRMKLPRRRFLHLVTNAAVFPAFLGTAKAETYGQGDPRCQHQGGVSLMSGRADIPWFPFRDLAQLMPQQCAQAIQRSLSMSRTTIVMAAGLVLAVTLPAVPRRLNRSAPSSRRQATTAILVVSLRHAGTSQPQWPSPL